MRWKEPVAKSPCSVIKSQSHHILSKSCKIMISCHKVAKSSYPVTKAQGHHILSQSRKVIISWQCKDDLTISLLFISCHNVMKGFFLNIKQRHILLSIKSYIKQSQNAIYTSCVCMHVTQKASKQSSSFFPFFFFLLDRLAKMFLAYFPSFFLKNLSGSDHDQRPTPFFGHSGKCFCQNYFDFEI